MKLALATVVLLALLVTVSFVYSWSRKSETDGKSDRINSDVSENKEIVNKIKRSLADDAIYGPSGLESDVDDTRDVDVHDRRELLGEAESEVDCLDGYPCRQKRSVTNGDMPEIMTLPNTKNENSKNGTSNEATDENSKSGKNDEVKSNEDSAEESSETNDEDDDEEEEVEEDEDGDTSSILHDGDSPIKVHRRSYSSEYDPTELENFLKNQYQDMEDEEDFADKYKREANGDGAEDGSDDDEDVDGENIEGMEENEPGDEGNENNGNERTRRETGSSFHHVEEELDKPYQEDESVVSDQLEEEMYNPPYNLVSSDKRRRKRSASSPDDDDDEENQNNDADDDDEGESDDESDNSMTKRDLDEIDNESNDENDDGESDVDDDVETEYNEQRYQRDAEDDDDDNDDGIEEENGNDGADEDTGDENDGDDDSNTDSNGDKQQQKRTTDDQLSELGDDDFKPVSSIRKARSLEYPNEPEASDSMAYDEIDRDPNSGYTQWEYWGACSVTCGVGRSVRRRTCNDERYCQSGDYEERVCFPESCATDDDKK